MPVWSWMDTLGKNSLMVYWVHVMLVYGTLTQLWKGNLSIGWTVFGTLFVIALMTALSVLWMRWKTRRAESTKARYFFFQAEDGIRDLYVTGVQTCALPI